MMLLLLGIALGIVLVFAMTVMLAVRAPSDDEAIDHLRHRGAERGGRCATCGLATCALCGSSSGPCCGSQEGPYR